MKAYYNEIDPFAATWLRNLIAAGHIAPGDIDERSIAEVKPDDLRGYGQVHLFAGIGGWSYALRLAGWTDDHPVWTGSCPCQPFSVAGKQRGVADARHLWPEFRRLISECRPAIVFGEQVASRDGREWLAAVRFDLEALGYAVGAADLCAAGAGAPHVRQRLWFVADRAEQGWRPWRTGEADRRPTQESGRLRDASELANIERARLEVEREQQARRERKAAERSGAPWDRCDWLPCIDGKSRPVEPGTFPLAHGVPGRVGRLRAYGNAIVPQVAAEFIRAVTP